MAVFQKVQRSLEDMLGRRYTEKLSECVRLLFDMDAGAFSALAGEKVDFYPETFERSIDDMLGKVGETVFEPFEDDLTGASTDSFRAAQRQCMCPISGKGYLRAGEDGKLYFISKSEHYHAPLGHNFPGFRLVANAKAAGIVNATHNNTRGYITRLLEQELIRTANGIERGDAAALSAVLSSEEPHVLNRVINLETGSLGVEAGVKMMLARFYQLESNCPQPKYAGRTPVFFVMGDHKGGCSANYHGTTLLMQMTRDMWPALRARGAESGAFEVVPVAINDIADFRAKMKQYDAGNKKVAGFLHEIVMMNYGAVTLTKQYLKEAYEVCHAHDVPTMADEIQSCIWYKGLYLFRNYGINPDFVVIGKGFSGGEYPASRILTTKEMDNLSQFGALVTNGQEELASLAYLVTMEFMEENGEIVEQGGAYYFNELDGLAKEFPALIDKVEGIGYLAAPHFMDMDMAMDFAARLNEMCFDVSAHGYKAVSLPAVLTKLPLISTKRAVDFVIGKMRIALQGMKG